MKKINLIAVAGLLVVSTSALAGGNPWWVSIGGGYDAGDFGGVAANIEANFMTTQHQLLSVRATDSESIFDWVGGYGTTSAGVLYGLIKKGRYAYVSASAGIGITSTRVDLLNHSTQYSEVGIPVELNVGLTPTKYMGVGLKVFANINRKVVGYGATINLEVGHLSLQ